MPDSPFVHPTAETTVISAMLNLTVVGFGIASNGLQPSDFAIPQNAFIFQVLKERLSSDMPVDSQTVAAEASLLARQGKSKVTIPASMVDAIAKQDWRRAGAYAETVKRMALLRRAGDFTTWFTGRLAELPDPDDLYGAAMEHLRELMPQVDDTRFVEGISTPGIHAEIMVQRIKDPNATLNVGWPWASWRRIVRNLRAEQVALLSAPSGVGKTTYLEMIAEYWAQNHQVVFVHLENSLETTLDRRAQRHGHVTVDDLEAGRMTADQADAMNAGVNRFVERLHYVKAAGWPMERIVSELSTLRANGQCDCIVLDYINKCRPSRSQRENYGTDIYAKQADDMEQLKVFCEMHGTIAIVAAQMNKGGNDGNGKKGRGDVRGSQEVLDKAQLVILVSRDIAANTIREKSGRVVCEAGEFSPETTVQVVKQNSGRLGEIQQIYVGAFYEVRDVA